MQTIKKRKKNNFGIYKTIYHDGSYFFLFGKRQW